MRLLQRSLSLHPPVSLLMYMHLGAQVSFRSASRDDLAHPPERACRVLSVQIVRFRILALNQILSSHIERTHAHAPHRGSCTADSTLRSILKLFTRSFIHFIHSVPLASFAVYPRVSRERLDEAQKKTSSHVIHLLTAVYEGSHCFRRSDPCPRVGCKLRAVKCTTQRREHFLR